MADSDYEIKFRTITLQFGELTSIQLQIETYNGKVIFVQLVTCDINNRQRDTSALAHSCLS